MILYTVHKPEIAKGGRSNPSNLHKGLDRITSLKRELQVWSMVVILPHFPMHFQQDLIIFNISKEGPELMFIHTGPTVWPRNSTISPSACVSKPCSVPGWHTTSFSSLINNFRKNNFASHQSLEGKSVIATNYYIWAISYLLE